MKEALSPLAVGQMLDWSAKHEQGIVLSSALSASFCCHVECKIFDVLDVLEIRMCKYENPPYKSVVRFVFAIPTMNDDGEYTEDNFAFDDCIVVIEDRTHVKRPADASVTFLTSKQK